MKTASSLMLLALCATTACQFIARGPEQYRDDTQALLSGKTETLQQCYNETLKSQPAASGKVGVHFTVQKESGQIVESSVDPALTTAPEPLQRCVLQNLEGLALAPPDRRDGKATFVFDFAPGAPVTTTQES